MRQLPTRECVSDFIPVHHFIMAPLLCLSI
jgi:hypothetical protein